MLHSQFVWAFRKGMSSIAKPLVVFVLGGPGAGKGTQCARIVKVSVIFVTLTKTSTYVL